MPTLIHNHLEIPYELKRTRRRRSLMLRIEPSGAVTVLAPRYALKYFVQQFVQKRAEWIHSTREHLQTLKAKNPPRQFISGELIPVWGKDLRLSVERSDARKSSGVRTEDALVVRLKAGREASNTLEVKKVLREWYTAETERQIKQVLPTWADRMKVQPGSIKVVQQRKRWASCSPQNNLRFNWRLSTMPPSILEYVVVHELAHIRSHDHSKRFWSVVEEAMPDFKTHRLWLRKNGHIGDTAL